MWERLKTLQGRHEGLGTSDEPEGSIKMDSVSAITVGLGHKGPNSDSGETYCQSF